MPRKRPLRLRTAFPVRCASTMNKPCLSCTGVSPSSDFENGTSDGIDSHTPWGVSFGKADMSASPKACGYQVAVGAVIPEGCSAAVSHTTTEQRGGMTASMNTRCHTAWEMPLSTIFGDLGSVVPKPASEFRESGSSGSSCMLSINCTVPVAVLGETCALKVTACFAADGLAEELSATLEAV